MFPKDSRILIVDDGKTIRSILKNILQDAGYKNLEEARDGQEALVMLEESFRLKRPFSLMIVDINMPKMDGMQLLRVVRAHKDTNATPVIMATIENEKQMVLQAITYGANSYVVKPISPQVLLERMSAVWQKIQDTSKRAPAAG